MKRLFVPALLLLTAFTPALAQEELLISGDIDHGGYGGVIVKGTTLLGEPALMTGGGGSWIVDHTFMLGLEGTGVVTEVDADRTSPTGAPYQLHVNEGGVKLGYIYASDNVIHGIASMMIGGGSVFYSDRRNWPYHVEPERGYNTDAYFVIEPALMAELNVASWMRIAAGAGYRFVGEVEYDTITNSDLAGPTATVMFKFGSF